MISKAGSDVERAEAEVVRRSVNSEGKNISYLAAEKAPPATEETILLIHGSGVSARSWTEQLPGLSEAVWALAVDLPGHGDSDPIPEATVEGYAQVAYGFLKRLATGPVFVAGHSLGGAVAQVLAARHPDLVKGLVLLSTCARFPESNSVPEILLWCLPAPIRKVIFLSLANKMLFAPGAPAQARTLGMEEIRTCPPETILKDVAAARAMNLEEVARRLRVPTLILCGSRDRLTPPTLSERLNDLIPGSRLTIVEGAGHMLPLEASERVNRELLDFVDTVTRNGVGRFLRIGGGVTRWAFLRRPLDKARALFRPEPNPAK